MLWPLNSIKSMRLIKPGLVTVFCICILVVTCTPKKINDSLEDYIGGKLVEKVNMEQLNTVMVIPNAGCNGCISDAEMFVSNNAFVLKDQLFTIFTDVMSEKNLRLRIGKEIVESSYAFVDSKIQIQHAELVSIYPSILYINKGRVERVVHISPDNPNALNELRGYYDISL